MQPVQPLRNRDGVGELGRGRQQPRDEILLGRRQGGAVGQANEAWLARAAALGLRARAVQRCRIGRTESDPQQVRAEARRLMRKGVPEPANV